MSTTAVTLTAIAFAREIQHYLHVARTFLRGSRPQNINIDISLEEGMNNTTARSQRDEEEQGTTTVMATKAIPTRGPTTTNVPIKRRLQWTPQGRLNGFPKMAEFLSQDPDKTGFIFKRFDVAATRNLLYLEGKVAALEAVQVSLDFDDKERLEKFSGLPTDDQNKPDWENVVIKESVKAAGSWEVFAVAGTSVEDAKNAGIPKHCFDLWKSRHSKLGDTPRIDKENQTKVAKNLRTKWEVAQALKLAIKEYHEALVLYNKILSLEEPAVRTREAVQKRVEGEAQMNDEVPCWVRAPQFLEDIGVDSMSRVYKNSEDLVSLQPPEEEDPLSRTFARSKILSKVLKDKERSTDELSYLPKRRIDGLVTATVMLAALGFLVAAIWVLHYTRDVVNEIGWLTAFVGTFAIWISLLTKAKKMEVFAATAAYAAVLVVYTSPSPS